MNLSLGDCDLAVAVIEPKPRLHRLAGSDQTGGEWAAEMAPEVAGGLQRLLGRRVLVVEDEILVCMLLEEMLADLGCEVAGPLTCVADALATLDLAQPPNFDVVILDLNIAGESGLPVASRLAEAGTPFIWSTGFDESHADVELGPRPVLRKPFSLAELKAVLLEAL